MNAQLASPTAEATSTLPSTIVRDLCEALQERERVGLGKYGKTLDRTDLTAEEWSEHLEQELLDAAGYNRTFRRELQALRDQVTNLQLINSQLEIDNEDLKAAFEINNANIRRLEKQLQEAREESDRQHAAAMEQHAHATQQHELLRDWQQLSNAVVARGLPGTPALWPNPWHQECAAVGWALDTIIRAAEAGGAVATAEDYAASFERAATRPETTATADPAAAPQPSREIKVYAVGPTAIEQILHEELMQRCATVRAQDRDVFQLRPAALTQVANVAAERLLDLIAVDQGAAATADAEYQALNVLGFAHGWICAQMDGGKDPREVKARELRAAWDAAKRGEWQAGDVQQPAAAGPAVAHG